MLVEPGINMPPEYGFEMLFFFCRTKALPWQSACNNWRRWL